MRTPLEWTRAAEFHLARDVDDLARPRADLAGNARRPAEGLAGDLEDAEPVDLPDRGP
jgi:hypothetical protein